METTAIDGGTSSQGAEEAFEDDDLGAAQAPSDAERFASYEARMELMAQSMERMEQSFAQSRQPATQAPVEEDDFDDDEPLTASRVGKIVKKAVSTAVNTNTAVATRREWDSKAKTDFPVEDPKFKAQLNLEWKDFVDAGGDPNNPKAIYKVCKDAARVLNIQTKGRTASRSTNSDMTAEVPTNSASAASRRTSSKIDDKDPRVVFYTLKPKTPEQVKSFKEKLEAKDARKRGRR